VTHFASLDELRVDGGAIHSRPPDAARDSIDGVLPGVVVRPESRDGVAAALRWADQHGLSVVIRGGGSKLDWGARPAAIDVLLDLSRLDRILQHQSGDLTVAVEAGARLEAVNEQLRQHGQWLALDPPFGHAATIGGLLATNDSGPSRHRFGTPRDLVIGIEVATVDGNLAKAGGQVVKNVAGYDLSKILSGSFGSLAAIVSATFKLSPVPPASSTIVIPHLSSISRIVEAIAASQLEPSAFELDMLAVPGEKPVLRCLLRFASFTEVVEAETANALARIAAVHPAFYELTGDEERELWEGWRSRPWAQPGLVVRASWLPGKIADMFAIVSALSERVTVEVIARIGVGSGLFRIEGSRKASLEAIGFMRAEPDVLGNVVVLRAPAELKSREWVWGTGSANPIAAALKRELDPHGILGAGRGPI
jgi:glycolate oxidase FAD binding subunit